MRENRKEKIFSVHWGSGVIEEEVRIATPYHLPTIQLLKFTSGPASGSRSVRFCYYDARGRFQRSPLLVHEKDVATLSSFGRTTIGMPRARLIDQDGSWGSGAAG